ncbi:helix-turn-helix domain-containing protein [Microvirga puerhi]|uniref:AraC family transcriptional regulator n=1 Tax=Microvirga puerhi TaxID=2876078 RepID=A0ABS7VPE7_9HYPH|nr:AraC family transcriptional regulator [Microvirga puerhi]MBZ6077428.1 AraC family transcriptional regulator [Microvirga puerhi]
MTGAIERRHEGAKAGSEHDALPASNAAAPRVFEHSYQSSNLDEIEHVVSTRVTPHRLVPLGRSRQVDSSFQFHGAGSLAIFDIRYGTEVAVEFEHYEAEDLLGFVMANEGSGRVLLDRDEFEVSQQNGVLITSGPRETLQYTEGCETRVLLMNRRKITETCAKLLGRDILEPISFQTQFSLKGASGESWLRLTRYAAWELQQSQSLLKFLPAAQQQLEQSLISGLLFSQPHTYLDALLRPQSAAAPFYVKRAEAYIEAHFTEPLSLSDIATQAGVSARSLQNGFQTFRSTTPMAFLRSVRLKHVHALLLAADPKEETITEIALACGFTHMGEFGTLYRRTFGVTPRETLLRKGAS